uniref:Large ribosomal subunit protein bL33 n=1 Tax=Magnetococcus massalia (strain MO-1) TaxID=451514 RepID=A0A1S7LIG2_MAGMO|nr:50S ribosomal protein L33 [Candidatus Magnetococcus massalia]
MRELISMACEECGRRNYTTDKNKRNQPDKFVQRRYCKWCKKHTTHKESKIK